VATGGLLPAACCGWALLTQRASIWRMRLSHLRQQGLGVRIRRPGYSGGGFSHLLTARPAHSCVWQAEAMDKLLLETEAANKAPPPLPPAPRNQTRHTISRKLLADTIQR
jgi:hypothetical protein